MGDVTGAHCLVVDISGSMGASARVTDDVGEKIDHGWTVLDIAKHAASTYVESLEDGDFLCMITYSSEARSEALLSDPARLSPARLSPSIPCPSIPFAL